MLIKLANWADSVTHGLTPEETGRMLGTEPGGMAEVLTYGYAITGGPKHLALAKRVCHPFAIDPLARGEDQLNDLYAYTQIPKITGAE